MMMHGSAACLHAFWQPKNTLFHMSFHHFTKAVWEWLQKGSAYGCGILQRLWLGEDDAM